MKKSFPIDKGYTGYEVPLGFGTLLHPKDEPDVSLHLAKGDLLLRTVLDVAERGREYAETAGHPEEDDRFNTIIELLNLYRSGVEALDKKIGKARTVNAA